MSQRLRLLFWSLLIAVTALSAVGFFAERVERALQIEGASVIASDLAVSSGRPIPGEWTEQAQRQGLKVSHWVSFPSVLFVNDRPELVQVKAVDAAYPLRGELSIDTVNGTIGQAPLPGQAFLAPRLRRALGQLPDGKLPLGELQLEASGVVQQEPDLGANLFQLAPRLLVNLRDAQTSGLLGPTSRAEYRLLLAGSSAQVNSYRSWLAPRLVPQARILDAEQGRPELRSAIDRGRRFLSLAALCASLVAGVAIMLATRRFVQLLLDEVAILRTLGMTSWQVLWRYLRQLLGVSLLAGAVGAMAGLVLQAGLAWVFGDWFEQTLPPPGWRPLLLALAHALILVGGFSVPSLLALRKVPPLRVLRRELGPLQMSQAAALLVAVAAYALLLFWQLDDAAMAGAMTLGLVVVLGVFAAVGGALLYLMRMQLGCWGGASGLAIGLAALARQPGLTLLQLSGFGLAITLLLLLSLVRLDILNAWQDSLPPQTPNYFLLNIQPDEVERIEALLAQHKITGSGFFPTTRGRLLSINGDPIQPEQFDGERAQRLAQREYNLGFGELMQADNSLIAGHWWRGDEPGFSLEQGIAESLRVELGDRLTFDVAGQALSAPVRSIRRVNWDSFNVNFFVQGRPAQLQDFPHTYITSLYLSDQNQGVLSLMNEQFPAVSAISLGPLLDKVRGVIGRGALAIEGVFVFTLFAAMLVSIAAVQITRQQRQSEIALLRSLGASHARVRQLVMSEFLSLGLLAGALAAVLANLLGIWLAQRLFDLHTGVNLPLWIGGTLLGALSIGLIGYLASRRLLHTPPMQLLR